MRRGAEVCARSPWILGFYAGSEASRECCARKDWRRECPVPLVTPSCVTFQVIHVFWALPACLLARQFRTIPAKSCVWPWVDSWAGRRKDWRKLRERNRLTAIKVAKISRPGRYGDGNGLVLQVSKWRTKSWLFRYQRDGRERQMGLGPVDAVSLADARDLARDCRKRLLTGADPIEARRAERMQSRLEAARGVTFRECADRYIAAHEAGWRNDKHKAQWKSTLATYVYPIIGKLSVASIDTALVVKVIEPIWSAKPETAGRVRGRIESVLDWAHVRGFRAADNPARWRGHLDKVLPSRRKVKAIKHHAALPYAEIPAFMADLRSREGISARALEFLILTAVRSGEVIRARWDEFDVGAKTWTIPRERMKGGREHRVPLSDRVLEILSVLPREGDYVFPGARRGVALSDMAMLELMRGMRPSYVPHGFRSTFRDWAAERTNYPNHVVEMALAHVVGDKVEAAYRRGDLFEKRRRLMMDWAKYSSVPAGRSTVVSIGRKRAVP
jgi:integrase